MPESRPRSVTIDAIVPVYGGWEHVEPCLAALVSQTRPVNVIIVDDCGPDDTADRVAAAFPDLTLLRNEVNRGFAATCNVGVRHGSADVVVLVNSDVIAEPTLMADIADAFDGAPASIASVCPLLTTPDGRVDSQGITADPTCAGFVRFHGADIARSDAVDPPVLGPYGAVAAYRRRALDEVGLLDEGIFMYGEELDLALRLRAGGYDTLALTEPGGVHIGGASAGEGSPRQTRLAGFGRGYLLRAWGVLRTRHAAMALAIEALVCARRLVLQRDASALAGRIAGWRAAKGVERPQIPAAGIDRTIGLLRAVQMRRAGFWEG
ncbi:glycosyltransferase family 2 protein [Microbacterium karelineae]|uniref:glycosyltransferase family 2 protein n=1 Tax=Microbacterium karelineae TaxID=2654283 RepID=UPI0018D36D3A|nr:glycosyltransferase family 2 protein [Microbacterium karelineae]